LQEDYLAKPGPGDFLCANYNPAFIFGSLRRNCPRPRATLLQPKSVRGYDFFAASTLESVAGIRLWPAARVPSVLE
jgi:hypothetical protein